MKHFKKIILIIAAVLCVTGSITSVLAYHSDSEQHGNRFGIASNDVEIVEEFSPEAKTPGVPFTKKVAVKNDGDEAYVRVKVRFSDSDMQKYCTVDWNRTDWVYADGYYYYPKILPASAQTPDIFTKVTIAEDTPETILRDFNIYVQAESIQVGYFKDYAEAWNALEKNR